MQKLNFNQQFPKFSWNNGTSLRSDLNHIPSTRSKVAVNKNRRTSAKTPPRKTLWSAGLIHLGVFRLYTGLGVNREHAAAIMVKFNQFFFFNDLFSVLTGSLANACMFSSNLSVGNLIDAAYNSL